VTWWRPYAARGPRDPGRSPLEGGLQRRRIVIDVHHLDASVGTDYPAVDALAPRAAAVIQFCVKGPVRGSTLVSAEQRVVVDTERAGNRRRLPQVGPKALPISDSESGIADYGIGREDGDDGIDIECVEAIQILASHLLSLRPSHAYLRPSGVLRRLAPTVGSPLWCESAPSHNYCGSEAHTGRLGRPMPCVPLDETRRR